MTAPAERRLVSIRRRVSPALRAGYDAAWARVRAAAVAREAHAWRFRSAEEEGLYLEFLEFRAERDVRADPEARSALAALAAFGEERAEEWTEIPAPRPVDPP